MWGEMRFKQLQRAGAKILAKFFTFEPSVFQQSGIKFESTLFQRTGLIFKPITAPVLRRIISQRTLFSLLAATVCGFTSLLPANALSLQGQQLEAARKTDFFTFFHMKERAIDERDDSTTHYFRPGARGDIIFCVDTDKQGKILQMALVVGREFIDDPKTNVFARDLVKSFIEAATPTNSAAETRDLVNEIFFRGGTLTPSNDGKIVSNSKTIKVDTDDKLVKVGEGSLEKGDVAILMSGGIPKLPEKESDGYLAFQGKIENFDMPITDAHVIMKNHAMHKGRLLEVRVDMNSVKKTTKLQIVGSDDE